MESSMTFGQVKMLWGRKRLPCVMVGKSNTSGAGMGAMKGIIRPRAPFGHPFKLRPFLGCKFHKSVRTK